MSSDSSEATVLVAASEAIAGKIKGRLADRGLEATVCATVTQARQLAEHKYFDLVFLQLDPTSQEELTHLEEMLGDFPETLVIILAPKADIRGAVDAVRLGAFDYLPDSAAPGEIGTALEGALNFRALRRENVDRRRRLTQKYDVKNIIGTSAPMQKVFRLIHKVAASEATVLIRGESGTGKELVARAIHYSSPRAQMPLVPVNCGAIPEDLLESELFGHEKGAFTGAIRTRLGRFEMAQGGTIFLDEIGDMSPMLQVKLLRVLQEHQFERIGSTKTIDVDIRVIAATHQDLEKRVEEGKFREDLYYRLNVVPINVPPLRRRRSDIALLCEHFLARLAAVGGEKPKRLHPQVLERLMRHSWPGNVRELENVLERMVILADGDTVVPEDLPAKLRGPSSAGGPAGEGVLNTVEMPDDGLDFKAEVDAFERRLILQALEHTGWVKNRAAALLKLNRTTLVEKIKKKGLTPSGPAGNT